MNAHPLLWTWGITAWRRGSCGATGGVSQRYTDTVSGMLQAVITNRDVMDRACRARSVLVLRIEQKDDTVLRLRPAVLKNIAFNQFSNSGLVLEMVLDDE